MSARGSGSRPGRSWSRSTATSPAASAARSLGRLQLREVEVARLEAEAAARELPLERGRLPPGPACRATGAARGAQCRPCQPARGLGARAPDPQRRAAHGGGRDRPSARRCRAPGQAARGGPRAGRARPLSGAQGGRGRAAVQRRRRRAGQGQGLTVGGRGGAGRGQEPARGPRHRAALRSCWPSSPTATADRDRLREQLRAQDSVLAGLEVRAPVAGIVAGDRGQRARTGEWRRRRP